MGKSTISMAIFNSFLLVYQRVGLWHWVPHAAGPSTWTRCPHHLRGLAQSHGDFDERRENWFPETDLDLGWWMLVEPKTSNNVWGIE